ncbi:MAG TPA: Mrp/NBP35 family ATP-binding protein [Polyangiaceae bacterium]|nr:Mrp/NBP35 family ATP-binding protein [Polyangiaceae bacterium]
MAVSQQALVDAVRGIQVPGLQGSVLELRMISELEVTPSAVRVVLCSADPAYPHKDELKRLVEQRLAPLSAGLPLEITWKAAVAARNIAEDDPVPGAKNILLVMSGKGGVGKSTVATNLALALSRLGNRVGLLDADIYGPSIPTMFGVQGRPTTDGTKIEPLQRFGVKLMSIGFLLDEPHSAVVWRGPMLHSALLQFLKDVAWGELDFLILDLPPGTGDVALTLSQRVRSTGAVIVTTPQEVALQDVYKSVSMAQKVGIPVLGVVENESYFVCDGCSKRHEIFGSGGGAKVAAMARAPLLGQIPIDPAVRMAGDNGIPVVQAAPRSETAQAFITVAERLFASINLVAPGSTALHIDRSGGVNRHLPISR